MCITGPPEQIVISEWIQKMFDMSKYSSWLVNKKTKQEGEGCSGGSGHIRNEMMFDKFILLLLSQRHSTYNTKATQTIQ
uniref:Ovule protein n=1 Tax=Caenorhabditis tropicalis TaxID=1561998 RepID=A0A1I7UCI8_9PELO